MFLRLILSIVLVVFGVASPWLVRDWLALQSSNRAYTIATASVGDAAFSSGNTPTESEKEPTQQESADQTGLSRGPYPVASATIRFFQGLVPRPLTAASNPNVPFLSGDAPPTSAFAAETISRTTPKLEAALKQLHLKLGEAVFIRIFKEEKELELWVKGSRNDQYTLFKIYKTDDWSGELGPKLREGDRQTPEGFYYVTASRLRPNTRHHLGLDLGYPNAYDQYHGRTGSDITIHGKGRGFGSFALADANMDEVYTLAEAALKNGQKFFRVNVFPFRMTDKRMDRVWKTQPHWVKFWVNLKEGYDFFENAGFPPNVNVRGGNYVFEGEF